MRAGLSMDGFFCLFKCLFECVKALSPDLAAQLGEVNKTAPKYGIWTKVKVRMYLYM